jgi:hypothetical protein
LPLRASSHSRPCAGFAACLPASARPWADVLGRLGPALPLAADDGTWTFCCSPCSDILLIANPHGQDRPARRLLQPQAREGQTHTTIQTFAQPMKQSSTTSDGRCSTYRDFGAVSLEPMTSDGHHASISHVLPSFQTPCCATSEAIKYQCLSLLLPDLTHLQRDGHRDSR